MYLAPQQSRYVRQSVSLRHAPPSSVDADSLDAIAVGGALSGEDWARARGSAGDAEASVLTRSTSGGAGLEQARSGSTTSASSERDTR
jgi:hypothetical protein